MAYKQAHHAYATVTPFDGGAAIERGVRIAGSAISAVRGGIHAKGEMDDQARKKQLMEQIAAHEEKWSAGGSAPAAQSAAPESLTASAPKKGYTIEELMRMTGSKKPFMSM